MSSVGTTSSRADPAVYSAERLQKRNPNIVPPGILRYGIEEVSPLTSAGVPACRSQRSQHWQQTTSRRTPQLWQQTSARGGQRRDALCVRDASDSGRTGKQPE